MTCFCYDLFLLCVVSAMFVSVMLGVCYVLRLLCVVYVRVVSVLSCAWSDLCLFRVVYDLLCFYYVLFMFDSGSALVCV